MAHRTTTGLRLRSHSAATKARRKYPAPRHGRRRPDHPRPSGRGRPGKINIALSRMILLGYVMGNSCKYPVGIK